MTSGDAQAATQSERPDRSAWLPVALGLVLVVLATRVYLQVAHPFLSHDDWDYLNPVEPVREESQLRRVLWEGRWLNYYWWRGPGHLFSPVGAVLLFQLSLLVFAVRIAWTWATGWLRLPVVVAVAASPMVTDLSYWPATLDLTMLLLAVSVCTLRRCAADPRLLVLWIAASTLLMFLTYPANALLVLVVLCVELLDRPVRELVRVVVVFLASYGLSTLLVFSLNKAQFGVFGLEVLPFRNPNKLRSLGDLGENVRRSLDQLGDLLGYATAPLLLGVAAYGVCLAVPALRERALRVLALAVLCFGIHSSATILTGATIPFRSMGWVWLLILLPFVWLAQTRPVPSPRLTAIGATVALVLVAGWGVRYVREGVDYNQNRQDVLSSVEDEVVDALRENPDAPVILFRTRSQVETGRTSKEAQYLGAKMYHDHRIRAVNCSPETCRFFDSAAARAERKGSVRVVDGQILVAPPHFTPSGHDV
ncbi:hypothetical protein ABIE44_002682 [Marmoricola sp. OAE513]|uniref:hypothetical protein n=1 Tax=Marmoricola sp. OAE513 TaxID=2817894 RepID=UPI001AE7C2FB